VIRVYNDDTLLESDIGFTASGDLDTDALSAFCASVSCYVTTWYDQSGHGKDATQTDPNMRPRIVHSGVIEMSGGHPALVFMGNQTFGADWGSGYTSYGHSAVYSIDSTSVPFGSVYHQGPGWSAGWIHAIEGNGPFNFALYGETFGYVSGTGRARGDGLNSADVVGMETVGVYTMNAPVGTIALYLNNILQVSATRTGILPVVDNVRIGSWDDLQTRYVHFHLSEMVFYSGSMADTERSLFTIDEKAYYGLDVTAPVLALNGPATQVITQGSGVTSTGLVEHIVANTFQLGGVAQGWHADDTSWAYVLPFDFTYYGVTYASGQTIKISSNGHICLDGT
jgi:hypothetical protein